MRLVPSDHIVTTIITFEEQMRGWLSYIAASKKAGREVRGYAQLKKFFGCLSHARSF